MPSIPGQRFVDRPTLEKALPRLFATGGELLRIWFTLKQMGLSENGAEVLVTTSSPDDALRRLFSCGNPSGDLYVPFAHTKRYMTMKGDAGRSIIQTNIRRWKASESVVTCDPTGYLDIHTNAQDQLLVGTTRTYPVGLGFGRDGFALYDGKRVTVPATSFAAWYFRQLPIDSDLNSPDLERDLVARMCDQLHMSPAEFDAIFVPDDLPISTTLAPLWLYIF